MYLSDPNRTPNSAISAYYKSQETDTNSSYNVRPMRRCDVVPYIVFDHAPSAVANPVNRKVVVSAFRFEVVLDELAT